MEAYSSQYVEHSLPLVLISGLSDDGVAEGIAPFGRRESGARIQSESSTCEAHELAQAFRSFDAADQPWTSLAQPGSPGAMRCKMRTVGRTYVLPARKAAPMPQSPGAEGISYPRNTELHSPLSPLSPGSPSFPDGILAPHWFAKHQEQVPAIYLAIFDFKAGDASQDDLLKNDIIAIKAALTRSGFRTRLAVILVSDQSILHAPEMEERLALIRRATSLDPKTGLFFMPLMSSQAEATSFVQGVMTALQPLWVEHYRELTKHARRKKARGGATPSTSSPIGGASQTTSISGWNVRYEIKLGTFAEFRQEMDAAERHYSAAIEELLSSEGGVFETTVNWSPRWDEARLLCDAMAIRAIRCHLWNGSTTSAVQFWQEYRTKMKSLIDQRGKGSSTYGFAAWEGRWAGVMGQLTERANVSDLQKPVRKGPDETIELTQQHVYTTSEKSVVPSERSQPFACLHHAGYWLKLSIQGIRLRWERALAIPDEDRIPLAQSPASTVVNRSRNYDTYLVLEPHEEMPQGGRSRYNHTSELSTVSVQAAHEFETRRQFRMSEQVRLDLACDLVRAALYRDAIELLIPLWQSSKMREEAWLGPFVDILRLLSLCLSSKSSKQGTALLPILTWELMSIKTHDNISAGYHIESCIDDRDIDIPLVININDRERLCPVTISFAFASSQGFVGEPMEAQLTLAYSAPRGSRPIQLTNLEIMLGDSHVVIINHQERSAGSNARQMDVLRPEPRHGQSGALEANASLTLRPCHQRHLNVSITFREPQVISISGVRLGLDNEKFRLIHSLHADSILTAQNWYLEAGNVLEELQLPHLDPKSVNILPKPPKVEIVVHSLESKYCTDEIISIPVQIVNNETELVHARITPQVVGQAGDNVAVSWQGFDGDEREHMAVDMEPSMSTQIEIQFQAPSEATSATLSIDVEYTLDSDSSAMNSKAHSHEITFVVPFEVKFTFAALLHPDPWPSYFDPAGKGTEDAPDGILQMWRLGCQIACSIEQALEVAEWELAVQDVEGDAACKLPPASKSLKRSIAPSEKMPLSFDFTTQKLSLDDRRQTHVSLSLAISWSRSGGRNRARTTINVPRLTIPASEPRVLCSTSKTAEFNDRLTLQYHLENPSAHFLTFALTMEANDDFAFGGPKYRTLSLAPLSRHCVDYCLLLHEEPIEGFWVAPLLQVVDSYYHKNLKIHPGGDGVKLNERREINVWVGPS